MKTLEIPFLSASELSRLIKSKEVSPVEATKAYLERIDDLDFKFNSYLTVCRSEALQAARDAGVSALDAIANDYYPNDEDKAERARDYLHANVHYELDEQARNGLRKFLDGASDLRLVRHRDAIKFY